MTADKTTTRDVHREGQAPSHSHIDSHQLQRGAQPTGHEDHAAANRNIEKMGFPKTQAPHADHADRNFSPADKLNPKLGGEPGAARGLGHEHDHRREHQQERERQTGGKPEHAAKGDATKGDAAKGDKSAQHPSVLSPSDSPTTGTQKNPGGSSQSLVRDDLHKNYSGFARDKDGHVNQISRIEQGKPAETTTYAKDGRPLSQSEKGNGERTWDHNGKLTSDTRKDKSDTHKPDFLKTTQNPDGTTTVKEAAGDGSVTETTFGKNGNVLDQETSNGRGGRTRNEFSGEGKLSRQQYTATDKNGKQLEQNTIDYDKNGTARRLESTDYKGNRSLSENDENGKPVKREMEQPGKKYSVKESWGKDGYSSVTSNGNDRTTVNVKPGSNEVEFKHDKLEDGN